MRHGNSFVENGEDGGPARRIRGAAGVCGIAQLEQGRDDPVPEAIERVGSDEAERKGIVRSTV
jgi:hypothetical protein